MDGRIASLYAVSNEMGARFGAVIRWMPTKGGAAMEKMILVAGGAAVGKTAVLRALLPYLQQRGKKVCVCKIDCLNTEDDGVFRQMGLPCVAGLSGDICPDHFLVSNLPELWQWANRESSPYLVVETAGLCHRCSPATEKAISVCVLDATASSHAPAKLGPMLTQADIIVLTKVDMVSQAEREIIAWRVRELNPGAAVFCVDGLVGYGVEPLGDCLLALPDVDTLENDRLRYTMPSGVCSYCVGERRVGSSFQQGIVGKIAFEGA